VLLKTPEFDRRQWQSRPLWPDPKVH
jgi:hypothetical protein